MIKFYYRNVKEKKVKTSSRFKAGVWIYVENPSDKELERLSQKYKLDKNLLKDALDQYEVPRMELENGITYIFTRVPHYEEDVITTIPLLIAISPEFILTLSSKRLEPLEIFRNNQIEFYTTQKTKFFIQIFSAINRKYSHLLTKIERGVMGAKVRLEKIKNKDIVQLVNFEEILSDFLTALIPTNNTLQKLLAGGYLKLYEEDRNLIEDLFLDNRQLIETCKTVLKSIVNIRDAYSTIMTNNLNQIIKFLTALTIILTVPTIISSFYGMNVKLPLQDAWWAFWAISALVLVIISILVIIFVKNKWF